MNRVVLYSLLSATLVFSISVSAQAKSRKGYDQAKTECLKEDANMRGKALRDCIKKKRK